MTETDITTRCDLQRSARYHKARERHFQFWSSTISFFSLLSGSAVVVSLLASSPSWLPVASGAAIALGQAIELIGGLAGKARLHGGLASDFLALERELVSRGEISDGELREIRSRILEIEMREPPVKRYLDLMCHNQVARSIGSKDLYRVGWWHRRFAQWLPGDGIEPKKLLNAA